MRMHISLSTKRDKQVIFTVMAAFGLLAILGTVLNNRVLAGIYLSRYEELKAIADIKCRQIVQWRNDTLNHIRLVTQTGIMQDDVSRLINNPHDINSQRHLQRILQKVAKLSEYQNAFISTPDGQIICTDNGKQINLHPLSIILINKVYSQKRAIIGGVAVNSAFQPETLDAAGPIIDEHGQVIAVLLLRTESDKAMLPSIERWSTSSKSTEVFILERFGDEVVYLNHSQNQTEFSPYLHMPISEDGIGALMMSNGHTGMYMGHDNRGVPILAELRPIPGSPWYMVVQVNIREVTAVHRYFSRLIVGFVILGLAVLGMVFFFMNARKQQEVYAQLYHLEREHREAIEQIRTMFYAIGDGVIATDAQGLVVRMNVVAENMTGWQEKEAIGQPLADVFKVIHEISRRPLENPVMQVVRTMQITGMANHALLVKRDGTECPIADSGSPIFGKTGRLIGVVLVFRDQSAERAAQNELAFREAYIRSILDSLDANICVIDQNGVITAVNGMWEQFALDNGAVGNVSVGANYLEVLQGIYGMGDDAIDNTMDGIRQILAGEIKQFHIEYPCHSPFERRDFVLNATPLVGVASGAVLAHVNITEQKQADERRELMLQILAALNSDLAIKQQIRQILELIRAYTGIEGLGLRLQEGDDYPYVESLGLPDDFIENDSRLLARTSSGEIVRDNHNQPVLDCICGALVCKKLNVKGQLFTEYGSFWTNRLTVDSEYIDWTGVQGQQRNECQLAGYQSVAIIPLKYNQEVIGLIHLNDRRPHRFTLEDIQFLEGISASIGIAMARRRSSEQIAQARAEAEKLLDNADKSRRALLSMMEDQRRAEQQRDALEAQIRQQQRLEVVGQMAAGVAHDFNNLMTGIYGFTQFAIEASEDGSSQREDLAEVLALAKRAADLTRQLLAFSRKQTLLITSVDINSLLENMMKMLRRIIGEQIDISFTPSPEAGIIKADSGQIEQVIMNLAVNARDAMPDGGRLNISTSIEYVEPEDVPLLTDVPPGDYVMLTVEDSGCGMAADVCERVFEPFFTTKEFGTGLGLPTVYGIIKQHDGHIWVESELGKGTKFTILLALVEERTAVTAELPDIISPSGRETVLIVEDEEAVSSITARILRRQGYHVLTAGSPSEARQILAESSQAVSIMVTDVVMPESSGIQLYESVCDKYPQMKVLYMSGYPEASTTQQYRLPPDKPFLQKPFTFRALATKVREVLGKEADPSGDEVGG
ncbi:MAG: ATP-binding protein [Armatimonadota bacterium]